MACMRLAACCQTTLRGPSTTAARDLLAPVGGQAVQHHGVGGGAGRAGRSSTVKPAKACRRSSASSSWPIDVHTSV